MVVVVMVVNSDGSGFSCNLLAPQLAERLLSNMTGGEGGATPGRRKWVLLGRQVKVRILLLLLLLLLTQGMFRRSPPLTYLYGALDTTQPPPKERKEREPRTKQATK